MGVSKITTHSTDALARLLMQYRGSTNIRGIVSVYAQKVQELEDVKHAMLLNRTIQSASGQQLDNIGLIVGQPRDGTTDEVYRVRIKFRVGVNVSKGLANQISTLFKLVTGVDYVRLRNVGMGSIELEYSPALDVDVEDFLFSNIEDTVSGGVQIAAFVQTFNTTGFSFKDINGGSPKGKGFGDFLSPGGGGILGRIVAPDQIIPFVLGYPFSGAFEPDVVAQWVLDEASGSIVDEVNGVSCAPTGTPTYEQTTGFPHSSISPGILVGSGNGFTVSGLSSPDAEPGLGDFMIEAWVQRDNSDLTADEVIYHGDDGTSTNRHFLVFNGSVPQIRLKIQGATGESDFSWTIDNDKFANDVPHKIVVTVDRDGNATLFIDDVSQGPEDVSARSGDDLTVTRIGVLSTTLGAAPFKGIGYGIRISKNLTNNSGGPDSAPLSLLS